ncbi:MAG: N,N'-diacetylchitobiose phosphorylase [Candidatus Omnitrophica bacterium ADurb.Bin277]|nr:MAG: N,N'-diacetylchitobiose phosphorylase [Candidatus Omnitrophica bacterium ADurb.Bin277]
MELARAQDVRSVDQYSTVVLGSAVYMGKPLNESVNFAKKFLAGQPDKQIAVFDVCLTMKENTEVFSEVIGKECDVSRRSYDLVDPCGRILFLVDDSENPGSSERAWPVSGNFPEHYFAPSKAEKVGEKLRITNANRGIRTTIEIALPDQDSTAEIWTVRVENTTDRNRQLKVVPYLEWVLNGWMHDRFHTQYQRLYPEMQYLSASNTMLSWNKSTKSMGFLASDIAPEGFLTGRVDFIGRARSIWSPRVLETLDFLEAKDTPACPTFDPIGSFLIHLPVEAKASRTVRLMIGYAKKKEKALDMVQKHLKPNPAKAQSSFRPRPHALLIGHGEIPQGTPQPYYDFRENGNKLLIKTPFTPRPFDHGMSNPVHSVMVTNRGLHTSCNGNSQQNRLTPDWPDTVTREIPSEAIYLYEPDSGEWYSPTHHPLNDVNAKNECEFGVDGTAIFRMSKGNLSTELTVFVPTGDPMGVYLLTVHNHEDRPRKIRIAPYFQMALAFQPERSGPLVTNYDKTLDALFFENPRNIFRSGPAFVSMSIPADCVETQRGRFFGSGRGPVQPYFVECAESDTKQLTDQAQIASFLGTLELPARGEQTVAIILGQTDQKKEAVRLVQKYKNLETVKKTLEDTREWWLSLMGTAVLQTNQPEFDRYLNWLKYQALAERIWARRGFYQTSGAYGFRDQLQDTVNLTWVDPALARKQIILHASQQFLEGDVFHWFFTLPDGRSAFSCRSHASDNLLWIAWGVGEYIRITGDDTILDEMTSYVSSEFPFSPLPKNKHGWGALYGRSTRADTVYRHCMRSIDTVLNRKMGRNGLPLMGVGDWNDGLDEIGSEGKGESVWLGFFLYYILKEMLPAIERKDGVKRKEYYEVRMKALAGALEKTWRGDRYLRAIHDDGTEIGVKDSGVWEIDALTAAWSIMTGINFDRGVTIFNTALSVLERGSVILLGWPALREDTKPYLGRSSKYPEGVRENGMYCHGVQWLVRAARLIAEEYEKRGDHTKADEYRGTSFRLWSKISPLAHVTPEEIEIYGGQPNKQPADFLTTFEPGRMIWNGYTGAAGWMLRQAFEGVAGAVLVHNELLLPDDLSKPRGPLRVLKIDRDTSKSPFKNNPFLANAQRKVAIFPPETSTA